ncbi:MAG: hypothetical protein IMZ53_06065 [Thermoplasmata archaeon]|nr:hypothetical protein [Thermoplasmata archaeon]
MTNKYSRKLKQSTMFPFTLVLFTAGIICVPFVMVGWIFDNLLGTINRLADTIDEFTEGKTYDQ